MKQYEYRYVTLPGVTVTEESFMSGVEGMMEELNRLGEEGWKESFKYGGIMVMRRRKPDGVLTNDVYEPGISSITQ